MAWHGKRWGSNDNRQVKLDSRNVSAVELTAFINGPYVGVQNKEESGLPSRFLAQDNERTGVPLTKMTSTAGKEEGTENRGAGIGMGE